MHPVVTFSQGLGTKRLASAVLQQVADEAGVTKARLVQVRLVLDAVCLRQHLGISGMPASMLVLPCRLARWCAAWH